MFTKQECKYYALCGMCTYHNRPCKEVCDQKPKRGLRESISPLDDSFPNPPDPIMIKESFSKLETKSKD